MKLLLKHLERHSSQIGHFPQSFTNLSRFVFFLYYLITSIEKDHCLNKKKRIGAYTPNTKKNSNMISSYIYSTPQKIKVILAYLNHKNGDRALL